MMIMMTTSRITKLHQKRGLHLRIIRTGKINVALFLIYYIFFLFIALVGILSKVIQTHLNFIAQKATILLQKIVENL